MGKFNTIFPLERLHVGSHDEWAQIGFHTDREVFLHCIVKTNMFLFLNMVYIGSE